MRGPQEWISWFFQLNRHMFKQDAATKKWALNTTPAEIAKVYQLYHDMFYGATGTNSPAVDTQYLGIDYNFEDIGYATGKYAMVPEGPWMLSYQAYGGQSKYIIEQDTAIVPLPTAPGGGSGTYLEVKPLLLNKYSPHQAEGWQAIQFLSSKKILSVWAADSGLNAVSTIHSTGMKNTIATAQARTVQPACPDHSRRRRERRRAVMAVIVPPRTGRRVRTSAARTWPR